MSFQNPHFETSPNPLEAHGGIHVLLSQSKPGINMDPTCMSPNFAAYSTFLHNTFLAAAHLAEPRLHRPKPAWRRTTNAPLERSLPK